MNGTLGKAPAFSMSSRPSSAPSSQGPGPGAYPNKMNKWRKQRKKGVRRKGRIQWGDRESRRFFFWPLGTYSTQVGIGRGPAYSLSGRTEIRPESAAPGPGAYSPEHPTKNIGFSMAGRNEQKFDSFAPGPGAYPLPLSLSRNKIGKTIWIQNQFVCEVNHQTYRFFKFLFL